VARVIRPVGLSAEGERRRHGMRWFGIHTLSEALYALLYTG